jgi:hypothetical protein
MDKDKKYLPPDQRRKFTADVNGIIERIRNEKRLNASLMSVVRENKILRDLLQSQLSQQPRLEGATTVVSGQPGSAVSEIKTPAAMDDVERLLAEAKALWPEGENAELMAESLQDALLPDQITNARIDTIEFLATENKKLQQKIALFKAEQAMQSGKHVKSTDQLVGRHALALEVLASIIDRDNEVSRHAASDKIQAENTKLRQELKALCKVIDEQQAMLTVLNHAEQHSLAKHPQPSPRGRELAASQPVSVANKPRVSPRENRLPLASLVARGRSQVTAKAVVNTETPRVPLTLKRDSLIAASRLTPMGSAQLKGALATRTRVPEAKVSTPRQRP